MSTEMSPAPAAPPPSASSSVSSSSSSAPSAPPPSTSAPITAPSQEGAATVASIQAANIPPASQQDTTLPAGQQPAVQDPNAAAPLPTLEELLAKNTTYEQRLEALKPFESINQNYGGIEAIQPALELSDMLTGYKAFDAGTAYQQLEMMNPDYAQQMMWHGIDQSRDIVAQDPAIRQAVIDSLGPEYAKYEALRASGVEFEDPPEIAPELKQVIEQNRQLQAEQHQINRSTADQTVGSYDTTHQEWLKNQAVNTLKWGDEHAPLVTKIAKAAQDAFNQDPQGLNALHRGRSISLELAGLKWDAKQQVFTKTTPPDPQRQQYLINQQNAANKIVQNRLAHHLNAESQDINKLIQKANLGLTSVRTAQEQRPVIPGSSAGNASASNAPDFSKMSSEERVVWRANEARKLGRIPS